MDHPATLAGRDLYEADEHEWIAAQVSALSEGRLASLDRANLIEYLTEMTIRDRRELQSRLTVLQMHLLKLRMQPERLSRSGVNTILEQQREIRLILKTIPSLARHADMLAADAWPDAVRAAARETLIPIRQFPAVPAWSVAEALEFDPPEPAERD